MEPAPYPPYNAEESQAIATFLGLIDHVHIKADVSNMDKVPNHDGTITLVDDKQRPQGELKIQVKKFPKGASKFSCPVELVGFSTRVSSPFILICVDVENRKAYWCHISSVMPGLRKDQKTFTVKFQDQIDEIGDGFPYIERWQLICDDYLKRISEFPKLHQKVDDEIGLGKLETSQRIFFQQFIEHVNVLLDVDFPIIKNEFFADTWKLGVSVHRSDNEIVSYSIFTIPHGENSPLLIHEPQASEEPTISIDGIDGSHPIKGIVSFHFDGCFKNGISVQWERRQEVDDPKKSAKKFVFRYLNRLFKERRFHTHGHRLSTELLIWFITNYSHTLGISLADSYSTSAISYGYNVYLPMWYSLAYPRVTGLMAENFQEAFMNNPWPSFEEVANLGLKSSHPEEAEVHRAIATRSRPSPQPLRTYDFRFESIQQAIDYLIANDVTEITRLDRPWSRAGKWIWDAYTPEDLAFNVASMLEGSGADYRDFIKGNQFGRLDSMLFSGEISKIYVGDSSKWQSSIFGPSADVFWVDNTDRKLPAISFIDLSDAPESFQISNKIVFIRNIERKLISSDHQVINHFSEERKIQPTIYDLLKADLEACYEMKISD
ncbi:MAG: hypothetical protein ABI162_11900 [Luteolibacter sp.]